jgi:hypothetical protein
MLCRGFEKITMYRKYLLLLALTINFAFAFAGSPQLVWHQTYGETNLNQQVLVMSIDNYDNMFAAGFVNFGSYGNIIINRYDGVGRQMWNRLYSNTQGGTAIDKPVALFPNNQAGVTVVGCINGRAILTHIFSYDANGLLNSDIAVGDTLAGSKTYPFAVLYDGISAYYMIGQLDNVSSVFKCDNTGNILWSAPLHNNFNNQVGSMTFDPFYNIVVGVTDSAATQVIIHRYDYNTGAELPGFNTHMNTLPVNDNFVKILVDQNDNTFVAGTGLDSANRPQWIVHKFDTAGAVLWSTICNSVRGHSNIVNSFLLDHIGDVLISGPVSDNADTLQYAAVFKIANDTGLVVWSTIDSQFLVNAGVTQVDQFDNVYLGSTKTPQTNAPQYSQFSFDQLTSDSGLVQWVRSFDNTADNTGLIMQVNNFGDLFVATNSPTDTGSTWFLARVGNAANDNAGTGIKAVADNVNSLTVFPNPFAGETNVGFTLPENEKLSLTLYDMTGRMLQQKQVQGVSGYNQVPFNAVVASGIYLLKLQGNNSVAARRVVVY